MASELPLPGQCPRVQSDKSDKSSSIQGGVGKKSRKWGDPARDAAQRAEKLKLHMEGAERGRLAQAKRDAFYKDTLHQESEERKNVARRERRRERDAHATRMEALYKVIQDRIVPRRTSFAAKAYIVHMFLNPVECTSFPNCHRHEDCLVAWSRFPVCSQCWKQKISEMSAEYHLS